MNKIPIRDTAIRIRVTPKFKATVEKQAALREKTVSEYVRWLIEKDAEK